MKSLTKHYDINDFKIFKDLNIKNPKKDLFFKQKKFILKLSLFF